MAIGGEARSTFLAIVKGDTSQAVTEFKKLGTSVQKEVSGAEGSVGKFQSFSNKAMAEFKQNAGMYMAGAGVAIGAFVLKAAGDFSSLGVEVGKFSDATGISAETSSRWIEAAGDIGVSAETLQKSIGKMSKEMDPKVFDDYGIAIAKTASGATDVNETFLNVVDRLNAIKDPAERAKVATKLLGRGWQDMAELIGMGSTSLRESMASVADEKVFDDSEVEKARKYRESMDKLTDSIEEFALQIGEAAVPALSSLSSALSKVMPFVSALVEKWAELSSALEFIQPWGAYETAMEHVGKSVDLTSMSLEDLNRFLADNKFSTEQAAEITDGWRKSHKDLATTVDVSSSSVQAWSDSANEAEIATKAAEQATRDMDAAYSSLIGKLDQEEAWNSLMDKLWAFKDGTGDTAQEARDLTRDYADFITKTDEIPAEKKTELLAQLNEGDLAVVQAYFDQWRKGVTVPVKFAGQGNVGFMKNASGTNSSPGGLTLVGEEGPEFVDMPRGAKVFTAAQTRQMMTPTPNLAPANMPGSGGANVTVVVNAPVGANYTDAGRQVADALRAFYQAGGARVA